jgi:hypothetical protein
MVPIYQVWIVESQRGHCISDLDLNQLGVDIRSTCNGIHQEGYDIISILPITHGHYEDGWSRTKGVVITGILRDA